ncbi:MAG: RNA-guided endonuclease IscB [Oscillospiraceae bacterium]|nr:RNA-guided endonuclease IscB [Oscillospiraceae bacterium]
MVFIIDANKQPLAPCHPARARKLLKAGRAAVWRTYPFTIILKEVKEPVLELLETRLKIDYGSRHTGLAILQGNKVVWMAQLDHRTDIKSKLKKRSGYRRRRRSANLRYRKPRFLNRIRPKGWLPPSLQSRVDNIETWIRRLRSVCPITHISYENCKFDTQLMCNPEISGIEYQQGVLQGYEVREYLLAKFSRRCVYCGAEGVPLEVEHLIPKSRPGSSDRVNNLGLACRLCNLKKGAQTAEEFGFLELYEQARKSYTEPAVLNATRWKVYEVLTATSLPVECGTGGRTKMNRIKLGLEKSHCLDACCIGASTPEVLIFKTTSVLYITAKGRGSHCRTNTNDSGFPVSYYARKTQFYGFKTGDMVRAVVSAGLKTSGDWRGRVLCRKTGYFDIKTKKGRICGVSHKYVSLVQNCDGYDYFVATSSPHLKVGASVA